MKDSCALLGDGGVKHQRIKSKEERDSMDFSLFIKALGLAFIIEGIPYFLFAERMPAVLEKLLDKPVASLRKIGLSALLIGLLLIYFGQGG